MSSNDALDFPVVFNELVEGQLDAVTTRACFDAILEGRWAPTQIAAFLAALRLRGETPEMLEAAARSMRQAMIAVSHDRPLLLDTCGTGGDHTSSVNLSTGAAIICAAAGVPVAKHGNRAASSQSGSADVLEALGIPMDLPASAASALLAQTEICFMFAPTHHPAMRFAGPVRRELRVRTIFNCLGPLANPASATHQLVGAFADELRPLMARTLGALGSRRAWVVRGQDGMDEVSPYGPTLVTQLSEGALTELVIRPEDFGLPVSPEGATRGGSAEENAAILLRVLRGEPHPSRDAFLLNAAAALVVALGLEPKQATERAKQALDDGAAAARLEAWRAAALSLRPV